MVPFSISLNCLDIAYSMNKLSKFMHHPIACHWIVAKQLLHYLKHNIDHGILFFSKQPLLLYAYFNAN